MVMARRPDTHAERVAARMDHVTEGDSFTRSRYRGRPSRGQLPLIEKDLADARLAARQIARAIELLEAAKDEKRSPFERDENWRTALGVIGNAGRACDDVTLRPHNDLFRRRRGAI